MAFDNDEKNLKEKKEIILKAAKKEFAEKGYNGARMGSIAKLAGVNHALIHYYFSSKENLYKEVLKYIFYHQETSIIEDEFQDKQLSPYEALYASIYIIVYLHHDAMDPEINRLLSWEIAEGGNNFKKVLIEYIVPKLNMMTDIINRGIEEGVFETDNPFLVVFNIVNFIISVENNRIYLKDTQWYELFYGDDGGDKIVEFVWQHSFKMLLPEGKKLKIPKINESLKIRLKKVIVKIKDSRSK